MISLRGVGKRWGERALFAGFDLDLEPGMTTVIMGRSGSGKSTLLRLCNQLERHDTGTVRLAPIEIPAGLPHSEWVRRATSLRRQAACAWSPSTSTRSASTWRHSGCPRL